MIRSCERRSFDAATIFIALVICCVFFTARIRRRGSISDGIRDPPRTHEGAKRKLFVSSCVRGSSCCGLSRREVSREFLDGCIERVLQLVVELLLVAKVREQLRVARLDELI